MRFSYYNILLYFHLRLIEKILNGIFDEAWEVISDREEERRYIAGRYVPPQIEPSGSIQVSLLVSIFQFLMG